MDLLSDLNNIMAMRRKAMVQKTNEESDDDADKDAADDDWK